MITAIVVVSPENTHAYEYAYTLMYIFKALKKIC